MLKLEDIRLNEFSAWLHSLSPETNFDHDGQRRCESCPVARFSERNVAAWVHGLPRWASEYIEHFDDQADNSLDAAKRSLEFVVARYAI